jgi:hypothetical protein
MWCSVLLLAVCPRALSARQDPQTAQPQAPDQQAQTQATSAPPYEQQSPEQLQRLVAPIALYPDSLVAQILAAATFPEQVVEADRWVQANPDLKGDALGQAVDQQPWDPSDGSAFRRKLQGCARIRGAPRSKRRPIRGV